MSNRILDYGDDWDIVDYDNDDPQYVEWRIVDTTMAVIAIAVWIVIIALAVSGR